MREEGGVVYERKSLLGSFGGTRTESIPMS